MILQIALKDLKVIFRDRKALAIMLLMPAAIMLILGSALNPMFESTLAIEKFSIAVVDKDGSQNSQYFYQNVLRGQMADMFETFVVSEEKANDMLKKEIVPSIIIIPDEFEENISNKRPVEIEVKSSVNDIYKTNIVKTVAEGYANGFSRSNTVANVLEETLKDKLNTIDKPFSNMSDRDALMLDLGSKLEDNLIEFNEADQQKNKIVTGMQYYCAGMLLMFVLFGVSNGVRNMIEERETKTLGRLMTTKAGKASILAGKFLGLLFITLTQALILILFTAIVYRVNWGNSIGGILIVTISCVFAASGLGMMIAAIAKSSKTVEGISQMVIQSFTLLGGGMIPIYIMPDAVKTLSKLTVNWWAVNGYYDLMLGSSVMTVLPYCGVLVLMGIVYLAVGIFRFKT
ncbi:ABC transporter permease [Acetivibrio cellulolyticus]|uniref:ABC transporter permease n=1 Tax=Acetivibrio cellulolyticus TaxID=35830 RepID=UPI0001E2D466|nr:ABC transporter permease [Acetivibrio cellulolyticus]